MKHYSLDRELETKTLEQLELGQKVLYARQGTRKGWIGTITEICKSQARVCIDYTYEGVTQWYGAYALCGSFFPDRTEPYITVLPENDPRAQKAGCSSIPRKRRRYLVFDANGELVEGFDSVDLASEYAAEQAGEKNADYAVYRRVLKVGPKKPKIIAETEPND